MAQTDVSHELGQNLIVAPPAAQDPVASIRAAIVADIGIERSEPAQIALSRFAALIDQLSPADLDKVGAQVSSILPALTAPQPNIAFVERAIVNIGNTLLKARGGIPGAFYKITNGSPIVAVYFSLLCSFCSFMTFLALYYLLDSQNLLPEFFWFAGDEFFTTITFAFLGAMVSIAFRLDTTEIERVGLVPLYLTNLIKPYVGAMFGVVIYCILQSRIITVAGINDTAVETVQKIQSLTTADQVWGKGGQIKGVHDYLFVFIAALIGFLSGFSERFATDLIDKSSRVFLGASAGGDLKK